MATNSTSTDLRTSDGGETVDEPLATPDGIYRLADLIWVVFFIASALIAIWITTR